MFTFLTQPQGLFTASLGRGGCKDIYPQPSEEVRNGDDVTNRSLWLKLHAKGLLGTLHLLLKSEQDDVFLNTKPKQLQNDHNYDNKWRP